MTDHDGWLFCGNCLVGMRQLAEHSVDAVVTDPPYGMAFMGKQWDDFDSGWYQRWCEIWGRAALRVAKPGAHLLAFSGTRTSHRRVCGLEDAGWEIRDTVMWLHGQGFPKSHDAYCDLIRRRLARAEAPV